MTTTVPLISKPRLVAEKVLLQSCSPNRGVTHSLMGWPGLKSVDPFIILDEFSAGFQIVTYMLEGALRYKDSTGIWGATIPEGYVQWVTAGRGLFFSHVPACPGTHKGLQIWINLPSKDKMVEPDYNVSPTIECAEKDGVKVRIIAGESMGVKSEQGYTRTPHNGEGLFGSMDSSTISAHHVLVLSHGDGLSVWNNGSKPLRFVLIGGQPLNEPVVWLGEYFLMNTEIEVEQAYQDLRDCKNGFEMAEEWKIKKPETHKKHLDTEDHVGKSVITIAGDNQGASMKLTPFSHPKHVHGNNVHIHRHDPTTSKIGDTPKTDSEAENKRQNSNTLLRTSFLNSNVQGVNNSILYNSNIAHHDPGIHLTLSTKSKGDHKFRPEEHKKE
ncbi:pirin-like protein [Artemisia annua]|uniref:Pirin-like protein n=1 Tax=Artemisia annua TaxID=35608 RepID=A0A2U1NSK3_ARTAN|nr:pirin-like protein [Artemisia annua]